MSLSNPNKPLTNAEKFLCLSGCSATLGGLLIIFSWDTAVTYMMPGLSSVPSPSLELKLLLGSCLMGWAVGKFNAILSRTAKQFAALNVLPFSGIVAHCYVANSWDLPLWSIFFALYVYFGYIE